MAFLRSRSALRTLVKTALVNHRDLRPALLNIEAARAQYRIQRSDRLPSIIASVTGNHQRMPQDRSTIGAAGVSRSYQVGLGTTEFEIDLFSRVKNLSDVALESNLSTAEATRATQLSLISKVIQTYLTRTGAQRRLALVDQTLQSRERSLNLVMQRRQPGTATALARADWESTVRQLRQAGNAPGVAHGHTQQRAGTDTSPVDRLLLVQDIAPGTSSVLIERRPDILASELRLKARPSQRTEGHESGLDALQFGQQYQ
ncbi:hypothetical protein EI969_07670 [Pseudomonas sp. PB101]|uniref:TolC family protein n=1 Tax=Pseudomonas sp. PB101 TaxID=2495428 RepID=UPI001366255B|nr:TolC family protein [Pseudomonas sp. PB101]MVW85819.1 hypothetical protein [Pseudomonas sp. PB101]